MSETKITQEERILLAIHDAHGKCSVEALKKKLGMSDKSYMHTLHLLEHGNFIKKVEDLISITAHGEALCRQLKP
jgi:predicted transcriptional regulator